MSETLTYEVYIRRGQEWIVEFACECRETALNEARRLVDAHVSTAVKVIEERFSPDAEVATGATIFHVEREQARRRMSQPPSERPARVRPPGRKVSYEPPRRQSAWELLVQRLIVLILVVGGLSVGILFTLAHLLDRPI